ncbi:MAG: glycosyltransferase [Deltaproteobacteria bacterium]
MKKILILSFTDLSSDPRVRRQIRFLKEEYEITAVGTASPDIEGVFSIVLNEQRRNQYKKYINSVKLLGRLYENYYWSNPLIRESVEILSKKEFDIIISNDIDTLPLALKIKRNAKVLFDAHEFAPKEFEENLKWRLLYSNYKHYLCKKYIPKADAMLTVCQGIADEYEKNYEKKPIVVTNAPEYKDIQPTETDEKKIRIIHHGGVNPSRKLEKMIDMMQYLDDRFCMDFMLVGDENYIYELKTKANKNPRIRFIEPVKVEDICDKISEYDIGIYILEPNSFNNKMALPNKFFEFIQARLAVAIGPSPEMARIVKQYDCGIIGEDYSPQSMAKILNSINAEKIDYYKKQSDKLAEIMCAENNQEIVRNLVKRLLD